MEKKYLVEHDYLTEHSQTYPSSPSDKNRNYNTVENGFGAHSPVKHQSSLSTFSERRSFDLSSTFDRGQAVLGWEDVNVFVHKQTGCFDRCLRRARGNIEFVINQILNGANQRLGLLGPPEGPTLLWISPYSCALASAILVNGEIPAKSLVAIMGPRGAGKTTLLNVLAHRKIETLEVTGTVFVREEPVGIGIRDVSSYVEETDIFVGSLTVYEHLVFQALLRMDRGIPKDEKRARVNVVMDEFDLTDWAHVQIGSPGTVNGIPRRIMKSLSMASELLANQKYLLFADDPLSGLDSLSAHMLMKILQRLTENGYTIICTIDQPTSEVYAMFSKIILLADGRIAYLGPTGEAVSYFGSIGFPCPRNFNPADFFIRTLTVLPTGYEQSMERIQYICEKYREAEVRPRATSALGPIESFEDPDKRTTSFKTGRFSQFLVVLWRCLLTVKRDKNTLFIRTIQAVVLGLITGQVYFQLDEDQEDVRNFSGLLFFLVLNISFSSFQGVLFTFPVETNVFLRENEKGIYCTSVYFLAKSLVEIPIYSAFTVILISIAYWLSGLQETSEAFFLACGIGLLVCHTSVSFGYLVSTATDSLSSAIATGPILILPLLIFGGFFVSNDTIPDSLKWLRYISWFNFGFENFMINQWRDIQRIDGCGKTTSKHCLENGDQILDFYQLNEDNFKQNFWFLAALLVFYRILAYVFLLRKASRVH